MTTFRPRWASAPWGATSSAIIPSATTVNLDSNISILPNISLEPPQASCRNHLTRRDPRSHGREVVLVDERIVRCCLPRAFGGVGDLVEGSGACVIESSAVAGCGVDVVGGEGLRRGLLFPHRPIKTRPGVVDTRGA